MNEALNEAWFRAGDFLAAGGPLMWPLAALSLGLWVLILAGFWRLGRLAREDLSLTTATAFLTAGRAPDPAGGPRAAALAAFLTRPARAQAARDLWWEAAVRSQAPRLRGLARPVITLAAVAPLLGLLGTVTGMIDTFQAIQEFGTGNAQALSAGISQALITTQTGLVVAIPGLFAGYWLRRQSRLLLQGLTVFHREVAGWLERGEAAPC
ncbi:MAG: MotA/TolQ/ExbB proton channel family protein [Deltaproteobacteria bacterium]|nr:MotA/TolQ/ExbB proton channel family protein [Deltaproteobacteria bacterium]